MDINHPKFSNTISELGISMEDQLVHDQLPFDAIWPIYPLQTHQIPSLSSNQIPTMGVFSNQFNENHHEVRGEGGEGEKEEEEEEEQDEELGAMKEMMYKIAAMQPVDIDPATIRKPKRRNVRISDDPQSVAARHRRERISEKIRILQRLVPGGTKLDTASMLDEAIRYVKFLKRQIRQLQLSRNPPSSGVGYFSSVEWPPDLGSTARRLGDHVFDGGSNCELTCFQNEVIN